MHKNSDLVRGCRQRRRSCDDAENGAFTLIEMTLAMAILGMISLTVFQFTQVTVRATGLSIQSSEQDMACGALRRLFAAQLAAMPAHQSGALIGVNITRKGLGRRDVLQIVCPAGNALLTPDAKGFYQITLGIREIPRDSGHLVFGMERQPWTDNDDDDDDEDAPKLVAQANGGPQATALKTTPLHLAGGPLPSDWIPLMEDVKTFEIAFFDSRLNGWVDRWPDPSTLPNLVRLRLTLGSANVPYEIVERVPGGGVVQVIPTSTMPIIPNPQNPNNLPNVPVIRPNVRGP